MLAEVGSFFPKSSTAQKTPPANRSSYKGDAVDLTKLPILKTWPQDGGPFITLPCVITRDPSKDPGKRNVGMYRMQVYDKPTPPACTGSARRSPPSSCATASAPHIRRGTAAVDLMALTAGGTTAAANVSLS